jgi:MFS family permease
VIFAYEEESRGRGARACQRVWSARHARGGSRGWSPLLNIRGYQQLLSDRRARAFSLAGFVARLPLSMTGIGIVLLVSLTTGSFGQGGLLIAVVTLTAAVVAPLWGRATDRVGQARVLLLAALINNLSLTLLIVAVELGWPLAVSILAAAGVGAGFTLAGSAVRARWTLRLNGTPLLNTAFALEAMLDEVVFIIGPILVTLLATTLHPALGVITSAVIGLIGAVALAAQRSSQPPVRPVSRGHGAGSRLPWLVLVPVAVASAAMGMVFGGMEVVVVAFAKEADVLPYAGVILMAWAFGSLVAGAVTGAIAWRASSARRFRVGATLLALSLLPMPFVSHPGVLALLLILSGMAIAPTLIASVAVTQESVDQARLTEALAWISTGMATGVAVGAAAAGQLIDQAGAQAGFVGVVIAGLLLTLSALFVRGRRTSVEPDQAAVSPTDLSSDPTSTPAAESSRPPVGTRP